MEMPLSRISKPPPAPRGDGRDGPSVHCDLSLRWRHIASSPREQPVMALDGSNCIWVFLWMGQLGLKLPL